MAGQSARDIRRRINSVKNIQQITRAMEIVAATKLRRAQQQVIAARPFSDKLNEVLGRLVSASRVQEPVEGEGENAAAAEDHKAARRERGRSTVHPLMQVRPVNKVAYVVITADRGLAGGYNANLIRMFDKFIKGEDREYTTVAVGRKGRDYLRRTGQPILEEYTGLGDDVSMTVARQLSKLLMDGFQAGELDEVHLVYTTFINATTHRPTMTQLLPITGIAEDVRKAQAPAEEAGSGDEEGPEYIYEPSPEAVLNILLPRYVDTQVYRALLEAKASELGARMTAMRNAGENAAEMIRTLNLSYNRARQAAITTEISEIVGGAEALASG